jgi:iron complex outermembrane receptor protein
VVWGGEWRREQVVSKALYNTDGPLVSDFTRLFGNVEWRMNPAFVLNAGAMAEHSSVNGDSLAPRVMLNWHATPSQTWRVGVSKAFRPPSAFEKFADVRYVWHGLLLRQTNLASGNVVSEKVTSRELGYLGSFPERGLNLDVRLFQEQVSDFTKRQQIANRPNVYDYVNGDNFDIQGLEYQLKWQPMRGTQVIFNQAVMAIKSADPGNASAAPVLASSLTLFQKLPGNLDLSLMIQDAGDMSLPGGSFGEQNWLTRTDLRLGIPLRLGASRGELALVVQNANLPFADYKQLFQFQRRAFVTLRLDY